MDPATLTVGDRPTRPIPRAALERLRATCANTLTEALEADPSDGVPEHVEDYDGK